MEETASEKQNLPMRRESAVCPKCGGPKALKARHCKACHFAYFRPKHYAKKPREYSDEFMAFVIAKGRRKGRRRGRSQPATV